ncbi:protein of unknown function [Spirosomataceae bacterium TFI 002]|nr:protein of unknown function [Spirosomataceae bacterium TFI 002]
MINNYLQFSRVAGALIILGIITGVLSIVPSVESEKYLEEVYLNQSQVFTGAIFQFFLIPIYIGFSLLLYPILKQFNESLSIGFVGFRFMAGVFQLIGILLLPIFVVLSQMYATAPSTELGFYKSLGEVLRVFRDLTNHLGVIVSTGLGNLLFYTILFREKLIPQWLSIWGVVGNIILIVAGFLIMFQEIQVVSKAYGLLAAPLVLQEIVLAILLILKGLKISSKT